MIRSTFACLGLASLSFVIPISAQASCYGTGYARFCDGIGGAGATYTRPPSPGMTDYYRQNRLVKSVIRSSLGSDLQKLEILRTF